MQNYSWLKRLVSWLNRSTNHRPLPRRRKQSIATPAVIEELERRQLLSVITVTTTTDSSNDGDTSSISALLAHPGSDRKISLREAILAANNTGGSNTILFDSRLTAHGPVTISPILVGDVTADNSAFAITSNLTIVGANDRSLVTLLGTGTAGDLRLFRVLAGGNLTLQGLTMTNWSIDNDGGVMAVDPSATVNADNCTFSNNSALSQGGAIFTIGGHVVVSNSTLSGNHAHDGGAFNAGGQVAGVGIGDFSQCLFTGNIAIERGGAIYTDAGAVYLSNCTLAGNSAHQGGGVAGGGIYVQSSTFIGNTAVDGGGIFSGVGGGEADSGQVQVGAPGGISVLELTGCSFTGNLAQHRGGAMFFIETAFSITDSSFSGNHAQQGGAIFTDTSEPGFLTRSTVSFLIVGSVFDSNSAEATGGGIFNSNGETLMNGCTFTHNVAKQGAALFNYLGWAEVTDCTVLTNDSTQGTQLYNHLGIMPLTNSTVSDIFQMNFVFNDSITGTRYAATNPDQEPVAISPSAGVAVVTGPDGIQYALNPDALLLRRFPNCNWSILDDEVRQYKIAPNGDCYWLNGRQELYRSKAGGGPDLLGQVVQSLIMDQGGTVYDLSGGEGPNNFAFYRGLTSPLIDPVMVNDLPWCQNPPSWSEMVQASGLGGPAILNLKFVAEPIVDRIDPPRYFPNIGLAQMHECHYKITAYFDTVLNGPDISVFYLDRDHLRPYVIGQSITNTVASQPAGMASTAASSESAPPDIQSTQIRSIWTAADGTIFSLGFNYEGQHNAGLDSLPSVLYRLTVGGNWEPLMRVYSCVVAPDNTIIALNENHDLQQLSPRSSRWTTLATNIQSFVRTSGGTIYALNQSGTLLAMLPHGSRFVLVDTGVKSMFLSTDDSLYEVSRLNQLRRLGANSRWSVIDSGVQSLAQTTSGTLYELNTKQQLKVLSANGAWLLVASKIVSFCIDQDDVLYTLDSQHNLKSETAGGHWNLISTGVESFITAPTGLRNLYVVTTQHDLKRLEAGYSWRTLQSNIVSISIDATGVVTALDRHHRSWMYYSSSIAPILDPIEGEHAPIFCQDPPSNDEVLWLAHIQNNSKVKKVIIVDPTEDTLDPPRWFADLGYISGCQLHHCQYQCTVEYRTPKGLQTTTIFIDQDHLIRWN